MKNIMKKLTSILMICAMLLSTANVAFAGIEQSVEDAYYECVELYPEFVDNVKAQGVTDAQIIRFLETMQDYLLGLDFEITEYNFEDYVIEAVKVAITYRANIAVRDALVAAYPGAVVDGLDGVINEQFRPLVETIKTILFSGDEEDTTEEDTTEEVVTNPPTEEETEPPTEEPTEEETEAPTEKPTTPPTENKPVKPTKPSGNGGNDTFLDVEDVTEAPTQAPTNPVKFSDMNQAPWAEQAVNALVNMGIISGYPDGTFKPNNPITRAEFAKIIVLASGRYDAKATCTFTDVKTTDWSYSYVASAHKLGFIKGRSETIFDPNSNITRADLCTIVYRFILSINPMFKAKSTVTFADSNLIPAYAQEAINALCSNQIATATDTVNNKFDPLVPATRAQCASIIFNAINAALNIAPTA